MLNSLLEEPGNVLKNLWTCVKLVLEVFRVSDVMKGGTPDILYDLDLDLDNLYSEPIDGLPEPTCRKLYSLFMVRWNVFHAPVHSDCVIMG